MLSIFSAREDREKGGERVFPTPPNIVPGAYFGIFPPESARVKVKL